MAPRIFSRKSVLCVWIAALTGLNSHCSSGGVGPPSSATIALSTTAPATVTLTPTLGSLAAGTYTATVPVTSSATGVTNSPQSIGITLVVNPLVFAAVSPGDHSTCGLTTGGAAYCWGYNGDGELGTGTAASSLTPVAVAGGLTL